MSWGDAAALVLGAALALAGGVATDVWRNWRTKRSAARVLLHEIIWNFGILASVRIQLTDGELAEEEATEWDVQGNRPTRLMRLADLRDEAWNAQQLTLAADLPLDAFRRLQATYSWLSAVRSASETPSPLLVDRGLVGLERVATLVAKEAGARAAVKAAAGRRFWILAAPLPRSERDALVRAYTSLPKPPSDVDAWVAKTLRAIRERPNVAREATE
jgi:hypothetical protein